MRRHIGEPGGTVALPADRGPLLTGEQVAGLVGGAVTVEWVKRHVPHKVVLTRQNVRWYEADVRAWLESRRRV